MSNPIEDQVDDIFFFHYIGTIYHYDAPTATRHKKLKSLKIIQFFCEYGLLLARPTVCTDRMRLLLYLGVQFRWIDTHLNFLCTLFARGGRRRPDQKNYQLQMFLRPWSKISMKLLKVWALLGDAAQIATLLVVVVRRKVSKNSQAIWSSCGDEGNIMWVGLAPDAIVHDQQQQC